MTTTPTSIKKEYEYDLSNFKENAAIDLSKGSDYSLTFTDGFGNDVKSTSYSISGTSVSATNSVKYYATVNVDKPYLVDGQYEGEAFYQDITDKFEKTVYYSVDKDGKQTEITKEEYDKITDPDKKAFVGTLKMTLKEFGTHGVLFTTEGLYPHPSEENKLVPFALLNEDISLISSSNKENSTIWYDLEEQYVKLSNFTVYEEINDEEVYDITKAYVEKLNNIAEDAAADSVNIDMAESSTGERTVTLTNYNTALKVDINKEGLLGILENIEGLDPLTVLTEDSITGYKGTKLSEIITSTSNKETFEMGTGVDEIVFSKYYNDDTVIATKEETLKLNFDGNNDIKYEAKGKDLKLTTKSNYRYIVTADVSGIDENEPELDGHKVEAKSLTFGMGMADVIGSSDSTIKKGDFIFTSNVIYEAELEGQSEQAEAVTIMLDKKAFIDGETTIGGLALSNIKVLQISGEDRSADSNPIVIKDITEDYKKAVKALKDDTEEARNYSKYNQELFAGALGGIAVGLKDIERGTVESSVTIKDFNNAATDGKVYINDKIVFENNKYTDDFKEIKKLFTQGTDKVVNGKIVSKEATNNNIDVGDYVSENGKGVKITTGSGNDIIFGSKYNDTIKSSGGNNNITEEFGTNTITLGKGNDTVNAQNTSSNVIKFADGKNVANLASIGLNKVAGGKGADTYNISAGVNTVKDTKGDNTYVIAGGVNKITGSSKKDTLYLGAKFDEQNNKYVSSETISENTVSTGKGDDAIEIYGGVNNIKSGAGVDSFKINGGTNIIDGGAGDDTFIFNSENDIIASINGSKGNDVYDLRALDYSDSISITDTKGSNTLILGENEKQQTIFFDVVLGNKNKFKVSNKLIIDKDNAFGGDTVSFKGNISKVEVVGDKKVTYDFNTKEIAQDVSNWMIKNGYGKGASALDVINQGTDKNVNQLISIYSNAINPTA